MVWLFNSYLTCWKIARCHATFQDICFGSDLGNNNNRYFKSRYWILKYWKGIADRKESAKENDYFTPSFSTPRSNDRNQKWI